MPMNSAATNGAAPKAATPRQMRAWTEYGLMWGCSTKARSHARRREPNRSLSHRRLRRSTADDAVTIDRLPIGSKQEC